MCGIVGYYGPENPKEVILEGLKTLEYRGYDSAGVAILHQGEFKRVRAEGKLKALQSRLEDEDFDGRIGIGHTRWATHGAPSERNAHPHCIDGISIVHNGIIENYAELKSNLSTRDQLSSDTDSELVAHLIAEKTRQSIPLYEAVLSIIPLLEGAYSILAISEEQPDEIVAFKNGPPLILGQNQNEGAIIIASDIQAIVNYTKQVIFLEDDEVAHVKGKDFKICNLKGEKLNKVFTEINWSPDQVEKAGYPHFMLKEIFEQPRSVAAATAPHINTDTHRIEMADTGIDLPQVLAEVERIFIVACGTSYYAGLVGEYLLEQLAGIPVETDIASEFRYRKPVIPKNSLVLVISQSGETADTLAVLRMVKSQGVKTLSLCNVQNSTIDREADGHLYMNSGPEIGVASTKAFASSLALLNILSLLSAQVRGRITVEEEVSYVKSLLAVPSQMETVLACDKFFAEAAKTLKDYRGFLYMGRGLSYPIALEGALKLKELAYMHAEGYAAGEMKHGPLALIDSSMAIIMLAPSDELYDKTVSNLEEAKARGGHIISLGTGSNEKLKNLSLHYLPLPKSDWVFNPLLEVIPLQLLSYHVAVALERDVDQPRNLAKSVTVE